MATKKTIEATDNGLVAVTIPRATGHEDPNFFVGINGKNYLIPKGKTTDVPPEVAAEVQRHFAALDEMFDQRDALKAKE